MNNDYNFPVELQPVMTLNPTQGSDVIDGYQAVVRQDTGHTLGIVSKKYELLKHADVIEGFRSALSNTDHSAKIVVQNNGAKLFANYRLNNEVVEVKKGDFVNLQFIVKNSYDGSNALQIMLGAYRLVCENGMVIGKQFYNYSQKHIGSGLDVAKLSERISLLVSSFKDVLPIMQGMTQLRLLSVEELFDYNYLTLPNYLVDEARNEYKRESDNTVWGYYNALTYAITHSMKKQNAEATLNFGKVAWAKAVEALKA